MIVYLYKKNSGMKVFKEGDILTLEDVKESFEKINNKTILNESVDLSKYPVGKDGAIIFDSWEDVETAVGKLISLEDYVNGISN